MKRTVNLRLVSIFSLGALMAAVYAVWKLWSKNVPVGAVLIADALTLPGIILTAVGAIGVMADSGIYDVPLYAVRGFARALTGCGDKEDYYEFKSKRVGNIANCRSVLGVGLIYLAAAAVLCIFADSF